MKVLNKMYGLTTPWILAKKPQIIKNKIIGKFAFVIYIIYIFFHNPSFEKEEKSIVVSLTSFPQRINKLYYCLFSLLNQELKPYKVVLWLANSQFPRGEKDIPKRILKLKQFGLDIQFCDDYKSYKKIIPAVDKYCDKVIVTADDDVLYPENWLKKLYEQYINYPGNIVCHRAHEIKFNGEILLPYKKWNALSPNILGPSKMLIAIGVGGVLYPPNTFKKSQFNYSEIVKLAPYTDDIYLKFIEIKNNISVVKVCENSRELFTIAGTQKNRLAKLNVENGDQNDKAINILSREFNINLSEYRNE